MVTSVAKLAATKAQALECITNKNQKFFQQELASSSLGFRIAYTVASLFCLGFVVVKNHGSEALKNAQLKDQLPGQIQATVEKIAKLVTDPASTAKLDLVTFKQPVDGALIPGQKSGVKLQTQAIAEEFKTLTQQAKALAKAYGYTDSKAYLEVLADLVEEKAPGADLETLLGAHFLKDGMIRAEARSFAGESAAEIVANFDKFIAEQQTLVGTTDEEGANFVMARVLKQLAKLDKSGNSALDAKLVAYRDAHTPAAATKRVDELCADDQKPINEARAALQKQLDRLAELRGTYGTPGLLDKAWVASLRGACEAILAQEAISVTRQLPPDVYAKIERMAQPGNEAELRDAQALVDGIFNRTGFFNATIDTTRFAPDAIAKAIETRNAKQAKAAELVAEYNKLHAEQIQLVGGTGSASAAVTTNADSTMGIAGLGQRDDEAGNRVDCIILEKLNALNNLIRAAAAKKEKTTNDVTAEFKAKNANAQAILNRIAHARAFFALRKALMKNPAKTGGVALPTAGQFVKANADADNVVATTTALQGALQAVKVARAS